MKILIINCVRIHVYITMVVKLWYYIFNLDYVGSNSYILNSLVIYISKKRM